MKKQSKSEVSTKVLRGTKISTWSLVVQIDNQEPWEKETNSQDFQEVSNMARDLGEKLKEACDFETIRIAAYRFEGRPLYELNRKTSKVLGKNS